MPSPYAPHLKLVLGTFFWALTPVCGKLLANFDAPYALAFLRFLIATTALGIALRLRGQPLSAPMRDLPGFLLLGATGVWLHNVLVFMAMAHTEANRANVIFSSITLMVVLIDLVWLRRRPAASAVGAIGLGIVGTLLVVSNGSPSQLLKGAIGKGDVLILLSAASWAVYSVLGRPLLERHTPLTLTFHASLWGTLLLFPFALSELDTLTAILLDARAIAMLVFLGVVNSAVGFLWYYEAVATLGATVTSAYINLVPIFGLGLSALVLGEMPTPALLVGGGLVLAALAILNRGQSRV